MEKVFNIFLYLYLYLYLDLDLDLLISGLDPSWKLV
jgi:hypothetical protein